MQEEAMFGDMQAILITGKGLHEIAVDAAILSQVSLEQQGRQLKPGTPKELMEQINATEEYLFAHVISREGISEIRYLGSVQAIEELQKEAQPQRAWKAWFGMSTTPATIHGYFAVRRPSLP
jgi:hypothetical protein